MISLFLSRLTYANIAATLALFVALGGSSYAAVALSRDSVKSRHIAKGAVKRPDIARSAVNSAKVANGSLLGADFKPGELPAGTQGPEGPQGPQGERGIPGENATKLFASIGDAGATPAAVLVYGSGVTGVSDPNPANTYTVTFDRSVANCVVHATTGVGDPPPTASLSGAGIPHVNMATGNPQQVDVFFVQQTGGTFDTSFMIAAFC